MKKILVTGGAGFIGSHLVDKYIESGHQVVIIDNLSTGREKNLNPQAKFINLDVRSDKLMEVINNEKPELVNHHAAQINVRKSVADPLEDAQVNIIGLINLMQAVIKSNCVKKVIFASTGGAIYGDAGQAPTPETYQAWPISPYGITKLTCEHYLYYYQEIHKIPFVSLRYGNVYGPRQNPQGEAGVVAIFCQGMVQNKQTVINGDGKQTRDYIYVSDVVSANMLAEKEKVKGLYNIGTGQETDVNSIFKKLGQILSPNIKEIHGPEKIGEQKRSILDSAKAKHELGWQALVAFEEGLEKTARYYQQQ